MASRRSRDELDLKKDAQYFREFARALEKQNALAVDRPFNWAFRCALTAFGIVVVWTIYRNGYSEAVLERGTAAIVAFGIAGYLAGRYVERPTSLPAEPIRWQGRPFATGFLKSGVIICETVRTETGSVLIESGTILTDELIEVLKEYEIDSVFVTGEGVEGEPGSEDGQKGDEAESTG